jgi:hypothetical protein
VNLIRLKKVIRKEAWIGSDESPTVTETELNIHLDWTRIKEIWRESSSYTTLNMDTYQIKVRETPQEIEEMIWKQIKKEQESYARMLNMHLGLRDLQQDLVEAVRSAAYENECGAV